MAVEVWRRFSPSYNVWHSTSNGTAKTSTIIYVPAWTVQLAKCCGMRDPTRPPTTSSDCYKPGLALSCKPNASRLQHLYQDVSRLLALAYTLADASLTTYIAVSYTHLTLPTNREV